MIRFTKNINNQNNGEFALHLYNTMTSSMEEFIPHNIDSVNMYVCGPTVYDRAHIGNARPAVVFDILFRVLSYKYNNVKYARNFTDIDDKIIARAMHDTDHNITDAMYHLTEQTIKWYHDDMSELNVLLPTYEPRATQYVKEMIDMIQVLINKGHAYVSNNTVLFDVKSYANHGKLSNRNIDDQIIGSKNEQADYKKSPEDFVLWKPSDATQPSWKSPWGNGRPGWHIECSAMIRGLFGEHIDIHGGGIDLLFPHHENEISQSCASCEQNNYLAKYWIHNNFVTVNNEKMSKSSGNFLTVSDLLNRGISGQAIRFVLMKTHYRQILKWTDASIIEAETILNKWNDLVKDVKTIKVTDDMISYLFDDLNVPALIVKMHEYANSKQYSELKTIMEFIGLIYPKTEIDISELDNNVKKIIDLRYDAKMQKRYALADDIRKSLNDNGIEVNDTKDKTKWHVRRKITNSKLNQMYEFYYGVLYGK